ncbi:transcriptional regulator [Enterococcus ureilyticus]|uniref:Transcriptional regulator n=1 Tax=Enterococcus ureilyticus TaxID=1131292 RepID=A0A1E5H8Y8_9ENTE|nr:winged helix-turn-helix domain-containing protein [Enterococcus ureilyticus]MBM7687458.1 two-component system response regulator VicR [Enterococcus ureilyticus]MBO0445111.1 winged helix-turn-helix domain-containing protein [Enterococcus ureilyticus]OEG21295.1 transcriptional regulator [Enterococcus ureilyticus]
MHNIGILYLNESTDNVINHEFLSQKYNIIELTEDSKPVDELHAVIIREEETSDLSTICDLILKIRKQSQCYIWVSTVTESSVGKLVYLQLGADQVFEANREIKEIGLIIDNALCRIGQENRPNQSIEEISENKSMFQLNSSNISVVIDGGNEVVLTKLEYKIAELLLKTPNTAVDYETIYQQIWNDDSLENKRYRVANVVYHLRRKVETNIKKPKFIKTVRSRGYMLNI